MWSRLVVSALVFTALAFVSSARAECPTFSGRLRTIEHDVSGKISVSKDCTVSISDFTYDGRAPQVYIWWAEECSSRSIARGGRFSNEEIPERRVSGSSFRADVRSGIDFDRVGCLSVYCEAFNANLGDVTATFDVSAVADELPKEPEVSRPAPKSPPPPPPRIPKEPEVSPPARDPSPPPSPKEPEVSPPARDPRQPQCPTFSGTLRTIEHDVSGEISVSKDCTVSISDFTYDGGAPQVYIWWAEECSSRSIARGGRFSDEEIPERRVSGSSFRADVRSGIDFDRVGCLSVYCEAFNANLGDVKATFDVSAVADELPKEPEVSRPAPKSPPSPPSAQAPLENCRVLRKEYLQVLWTLSNDQDIVTMAIEGRPGSGDAWMAFGYSPADSFGAQMVGARVVVAGYAGDECFAYDYSLSNREQCDFLNGMGVCPTAYSGNSAGVAEIPIPPLQIECQRSGSYMRVLFERPVETWPLDGGDSAVWAMGPVSPGSDASRPVVLYHSLALPGKDGGAEPVNTPTGENLVVALDETQNSCSDISALSDDVENQEAASNVPVLYDTTDFVVTSGPYDVHPDPPGWGLGYIVNDVALPVINMVRGQTYTFSIQAGPTHPLYFTTSPFGAGELSDFENEVVYAGGIESFGTEAEPYVLAVTPDDTWPDLLYYQCAVHQKLGWQAKIYDTQEESDKAGMAVDPKAAFAGLPTMDGEGEGAFVQAGACEMTLDGATIAFQSCATIPGGNTGNTEFNYAWSVSAGADPSFTRLSMGINATLPDDAYVAIAIPEYPNTMVGSDALVLSRETSGVVQLLPYYLGGQTQSAVTQLPDDYPGIIETSSSLDGDTAVGTFTVQIPVSFTDTVALESYNFLWASGRINSQGAPTYHGLGKGGIDANLISGTSASNTNTQTINWSARKAHMWLMAIGWGLLVPCGVVSVRAKKSALPHAWFKVHRAAMTLGYLCGVGGIIAGFSVRGTWEMPYSAHRDLGITITVLGFVQLLSIVARPAPDSRVRPIWVSWHRVIGVSTVCLAIANVYYGMFYVAQVATWAWGLYSACLAAIVAVAVANEMWAVRHATTTLQHQPKTDGHVVDADDDIGKTFINVEI